MSQPSNTAPIPSQLQAIEPKTGAAIAEEPLLPASAALPATALPSGFHVDETGVYELRRNPDGDDEPVRICSRLEVVGRCRRAAGDGWGRLVEFVDHEGRRRRSVIEEQTLSGAATAALKNLRDRGLDIAIAEKSERSVAKFIKSCRSDIIYTRVDRAGWIDGRFDTFVFPDGATIGKRPIIPEASLDESEPFRKGNLDQWREKTAKFCAGNPLLILVVSHAFSGPLLEPLGLDGGGFHLRGASSCGKSTALAMAASVWGPPSSVVSWRATDNGIEGVAARANATLLALDELHEAPAHSAGDVIYMLGNGRAKTRANALGRATATATWHTPLISSGEISLADHMKSAGKAIFAGQELRLLDICADGRRFGAFDDLSGVGDPGRFAEVLRSGTEANYGVAGAAFVERLISSNNAFERLRTLIDRHVGLAIASFGAPLDSQAQRALRRFMIAGIAGEAATAFGLTGWNTGDAHRAATELFKRWFVDRTGMEATEVAAILGKTASFIAANNNRLTGIGDSASYDQIGWKDDAYFYLTPTAWKDLHGEDAADAARIHDQRGFLRKHGGSGFQFRMPRAVRGRPWAYAVKRSILNP